MQSKKPVCFLTSPTVAPSEHRPTFQQVIQFRAYSSSARDKPSSRAVHHRTIHDAERISASTFFFYYPPLGGSEIEQTLAVDRQPYNTPNRKPHRNDLVESKSRVYVCVFVCALQGPPMRRKIYNLTVLYWLSAIRWCALD